MAMNFLQKIYNHYGPERIGWACPEWEDDINAYYNSSKQFIAVVDGKTDDRLLFIENIDQKTIGYPYCTMWVTEKHVSIRAHKSKESAVEFSASTLLKVPIEKISMVEW